MTTNLEMIKKFANEIAREYVEHRQPITDSVISFCEENQLNPEQVRNLVQLINTLIHLLLFESKTEDKIIEFEPLDPDEIIKKIFSTPPEDDLPNDTSETISFDLYDDLTSTFRNLQERLGITKEKTIDLTDIFGPGLAQIKEEQKPNAYKKQLLIMKIQKTAEELHMRSKEAAFEYMEILDSLASKFAMLYGPDLEEFEKDALSLRGDKAIPILRDLRACLQKEPITYSKEMIKQARVVDGSTTEMQMLDCLIMLHDDYVTAKIAAERLENVLSEL